MQQADIGLIGLAVMGQNLVLNLNDHGFKVAVFNRTVSKVDDFLNGPAKGTAVIGTHSLEQFVKTLKTPRIILLMVKAGAAVDQFVQQLVKYLQPHDVIIDGGNSQFSDTLRRLQEVTPLGILYVGAGISGGESGARFGPAIMPGGNSQAWPTIQPILQAIAAKVEGEPCCQWVGDSGAGHYVKMVHNGIEYGDMQLIAEAYHLLREGLGLPVDQLQHLFSDWNQGVLQSYLIDITSHLLKVKEPDGTPRVNQILDVAEQKGTGQWTGVEALELRIPVTLITEAVFARCLSGMKNEREAASKLYSSQRKPFQGDREAVITAVHEALYASKIISYTQGYMLMRQAAQQYGWQLRYGDIAMIWRGGCIIRSRFLNNIKQAFDKNPELPNLLLDDFFINEIKKAETGWRKAVMLAIELGIPTPAFSSALAFYDGYRCERLPANLLQAQRDYFGAHTYERIDQPRGTFFHTEWATGQEEKVS